MPGFVVCTATNSPATLNASPLAPPEFSRYDAIVLSAAMRVMRFACPSVKITLPSGSAIGPSVPWNPSLISSIGVPAATTPSIAGVDKSIRV